MNEEISQHLIGISSGRNFRELGGYRTLSGKCVQKHKLLRTGNLADLSPFDLDFLSDYGVKYVVDFRSREEVKRQPDRLPHGAAYIYDPVFSKDLTNSSKSVNDLEKQAANDADFGFNHMLYAYEDMVESDHAQKAYRKFFQILLKNTGANQAVIFHCTAGKDRTGFGAVLILTALGVPLKTIRRDYLATNQVIKNFVTSLLKRAQNKGNNQNVLTSIHDIQSVQPAYLDHLLKVLNDHYGSINNYLRQVINLSAADFLQLRRNYLTA